MARVAASRMLQSISFLAIDLGRHSRHPVQLASFPAWRSSFSTALAGHVPLPPIVPVSCFVPRLMSY